MVLYFTLAAVILLSAVILILLLIPFRIKAKLKVNGENNRYARVDLNYFFKAINFSYNYNFSGDEDMSFHLLGFDMMGEE